VALLIGLAPNLPGMAAAVAPHLNIGGASKIYDMFYLYGFASTFAVHAVLNWAFPSPDTLIPSSIQEDIVMMDGVEIVNDGAQDSQLVKTVAGTKSAEVMA